MRCHLYQLLFDFLDLRDVQLIQQIVHQAGGWMDTFSFFGRGNTLVIGVGDFLESVLVNGIVVVGHDRGVVAELQPVERDAQRTVVHRVSDGHVLGELLSQGRLNREKHIQLN